MPTDVFVNKELQSKANLLTRDLIFWLWSTIDNFKQPINQVYGWLFRNIPWFKESFISSKDKYQPLIEWYLNDKYSYSFLFK
jgi:hypothetical protein